VCANPLMIKGEILDAGEMIFGEKPDGARLSLKIE